MVELASRAPDLFEDSARAFAISPSRSALSCDSRLHERLFTTRQFNQLFLSPQRFKLWKGQGKITHQSNARAILLRGGSDVVRL